MKAKILVLTCDGGGGHKSAGDSLLEILSPFHEVQIVNAIDTILEPLDWFKRLSFGKITGESCYNWLLRNQLGALLKFYIFSGKRHMHVRKKKIARIFCRYLDSLIAPPQLIISTIPFINHGLLLAAKQRNIPYLLLPTDLDIKMFLNGFNNISRADLGTFKLALAYERPEMMIKIFEESQLELDDVIYSGFPIRPACQVCYGSEDIALLKQQHGMVTDHHTITLVMGAVGGMTIVEHAKEISRLGALIHGKKLQANICVGKNKKSQERLLDWIVEQGGTILSRKEHVTTAMSKEGVLLHIRGFTNELISIFACSDLVISKTGSCTVNEALYLGKKLLLDNTPQSTARFIFWEEFNIWFVKRHKLGSAFSSSKQLRALIPYMLKMQDPPSPPFCLPDFQTNIKNIVRNLLSTGCFSESVQDEASLYQEKSQ
ncbi:MAG: hypothetical protein KGZ39_06415 [Simkania sp.]|nr:hypothetical protein [Simkania sp.]